MRRVAGSMSLIVKTGLQSMSIFAASTANTLFDCVLRAQRLLSMLPASLFEALGSRTPLPALTHSWLTSELTLARCLQMRDVLLGWHTMRRHRSARARLEASIRCRVPGLFLDTRPVPLSFDSVIAFAQSESRHSAIPLSSPVSAVRLQQLRRMLKENPKGVEAAIDVSLVILELCRSLVNARMIAYLLINPQESLNPLRYHRDRIENCKAAFEKLNSGSSLIPRSDDDIGDVDAFLRVPDALSPRFTRLRHACVLAISGADCSSDLGADSLQQMHSSLEDINEDALPSLMQLIRTEFSQTFIGDGVALTEAEGADIRELLMLDTGGDRTVSSSRSRLASDMIGLLRDAYAFAANIVLSLMNARWRRELTIKNRLNPMVPLCGVADRETALRIYPRLLDASFLPYLEDRSDAVPICAAALSGNTALLKAMLSAAVSRQYESLLWHVLLASSDSGRGRNKYLDVIETVSRLRISEPSAIGGASCCHIALLNGLTKFAFQFASSDFTVDRLGAALLLLSKDAACFNIGLDLCRSLDSTSLSQPVHIQIDFDACSRSHFNFCRKHLPWLDEQAIRSSTTQRIATLKRSLQYVLRDLCLKADRGSNVGPSLLISVLHGLVAFLPPKESGTSRLNDQLLVSALEVVKAVMSELPEVAEDVFDFACRSRILAFLLPRLSFAVDWRLVVRGLGRDKCSDVDGTALLAEIVKQLSPDEARRLIAQPISAPGFQHGDTLLAHAVRRSMPQLTAKLVELGAATGPMKQQGSDLLRLSVSLGQGRITQILQPAHPLADSAAMIISRFVRGRLIRLRRSRAAS